MAVEKLRVESVSIPTNRRNRARVEEIMNSPEEKERAKGRKEYYDRALSVRTPREYFGKKSIGQPVRGVKELKVKNESKKVSYRNRINDSEGTYYAQRLTITKSDLERINSAINDEIKNDYPNVSEYAFDDKIRATTYLKPLRTDEKGVAYLSITQLRFIKRVLGDIPRLKDTANAYIIVRENRRTNKTNDTEGTHYQLKKPSRIRKMEETNREKARRMFKEVPVDLEIEENLKIIEGTDSKESELSEAEIWDLIVDYRIATEEELRLVCNIIGYSVETLNNVIYVRTGYNDIEQYLED